MTVLGVSKIHRTGLRLAGIPFIAIMILIEKQIRVHSTLIEKIGSGEPDMNE
jgi:hypothetical protein